VGQGPAERELDATSVLDRKRRALLEYRSQLTVGDDWFAGANGEREAITVVERFHRQRPDARADGSYAAQSTPLKIFTLAVCALLGAAAGLLFTAAHQSSLLIAIGGVVAVIALLAGLRTVFRSRLVALIAAGGIAIGDLVLRIGSSASAQLDALSVQGVVWTWAAVVAVVLVLALPGFRPRRRG
jgi:N-acetyl-1-D-myo-inositol-2-amino-2-deoxy-alpha-D-glucopyranoside deacetylase